MGAPYALSSDLVSAWPAKSLEVAQYIDGQVPLIAMTQNAQTGTTYSLTATDFTKLVTLSNASPVTVTVPLESSVAWVAGTQLRLMNLGAGLVTVAGAVGVTINGSPLTLAQYKNATLTKTGTNTWTFNGSSAAPGMDLITPTSVAGTGVTLSGGQVSFSAATTVTVNGCFTSAYNVYQIVASGVFSSNVIALMRMVLAGVEASTNVYYRQRLTASSSSVTGSAATSTSGAVGSWDTSKSNLSLYVFNPALAETTTWQGNSWASPATTIDQCSGLHDVATAYDGVKLFPTSGTATGTLRIYGLRNS